MRASRVFSFQCSVFRSDAVIPAQAGIQGLHSRNALDSRVRGNDARGGNDARLHSLSTCDRRVAQEPLNHWGESSGGKRSEPRGFTLLELLIAIGLTSILMIALFAAMDIYFKLQLDGHEEITRQQIARTLLRQITRDAQSVVFVKKETLDDEDSSSSSGSGSTGTGSTGTGSTGTGSTGTGTTGTGSTGTGSTGTGSSGTGSTGTGSTGTGTTGTGSTGTGSTSTGSSTAAATDTAMTTYTNGLVGSATDLLLYVSRPDKNMSYVLSENLTSTKDRTSDLMIIRYMVADTGAGGLSSQIADRFAGSDRGAIGLVRITGDLYGMSTAVQEGEDENFTLVDKIDAKEVSAVNFRYFDGLNWLESWDSTELNQMPTAVEVTLTLRNAESGGEAFMDAADPYALGETTHKMVIAIPVAEPFVGETAL